MRETLRSSKESDDGVVKICGSAALGSATRPPPSSVTGASSVRAVSAYAGPAVETSADLTCSERPAAVELQQERGRARDVRRRHRRAVEDREARRVDVVGGSRRGSGRPGAETSGFRSWPNAVGPADEKLVITPLRPVSSSSGARPTRICRPAAVRRRGRRAAVRRRGSRSSRRERPGRPAARSPRPRGCRRRRSRSRRRPSPAPPSPASGQRPRSTSAIAPASEPAGSVPTGRRAFRAARRGGARRASRRCPRSRRRRRASGRRCPTRSAAARCSRPGTGCHRGTSGAPAAVTSSAGAKTCVFDTAATEIASGAVPGEPAEPSAEVVAVVAGRDHGHDARGGEVVHRLDERVVRRVDLRAAAREVDDVHAVLHRRLEGGDDLGRVGDVADRRRHREHAVVAEPRARRDAAQAGDASDGRCPPARSCPTRPRRCRRRACRGTTSRDRPRGVPGCRRSGRGRPSRRSPSASSTSRRRSGSPAGYEKPAGSKNGFDWSMPSSTTAILMPVPSADVVRRRTSAPMIDGERSSASV